MSLARQSASSFSLVISGGQRIQILNRILSAIGRNVGNVTRDTRDEPPKRFRVYAKVYLAQIMRTASLAACILLVGCLTPHEQSYNATVQAVNCVNRKQYSAAIDYAKQATSKDPSYSDAWFWRGEAYWLNHQYD